MFFEGFPSTPSISLRSARHETLEFISLRWAEGIFFRESQWCMFQFERFVGKIQFGSSHWFNRFCWKNRVGKIVTLQGTNISPKNGILKMMFLFPRWDMLIPWRVIPIKRCSFLPSDQAQNQQMADGHFTLKPDEQMVGGSHQSA